MPFLVNDTLQTGGWPTTHSVYKAKEHHTPPKPPLSPGARRPEQCDRMPLKTRSPAGELPAKRAERVIWESDGAWFHSNLSL